MVEDAIPQDRPLLVFVHAQWCGSCRRAEPAVASLRSEYAGRVSFVELDVTDEETATRSAMTAERLGLGAFFSANDGRTGVTILGRDRKSVRRLAGEARPAPYRSALEAAFATFERKMPQAGSNPFVDACGIQLRVLDQIACPAFARGCAAVADAPFAHPLGVPDALPAAAMYALLFVVALPRKPTAWLRWVTLAYDARALLPGSRRRSVTEA